MLVKMESAGSGGGGLKRAEGDFSTINGTQTVTVSDLTNIEFVLAYYSVAYDNGINTSASKIDGVFVNYPWYGGSVNNNRITAINGNTFDIIWGSADSGWKYIAYGT